LLGDCLFGGGGLSPLRALTSASLVGTMILCSGEPLRGDGLFGDLVRSRDGVKGSNGKPFGDGFTGDLIRRRDGVKGSDGIGIEGAEGIGLAVGIEGAEGIGLAVGIEGAEGIGLAVGTLIHFPASHIVLTGVGKREGKLEGKEGKLATIISPILDAMDFEPRLDPFLGPGRFLHAPDSFLPCLHGLREPLREPLRERFTEDLREPLRGDLRGERERFTEDLRGDLGEREPRLDFLLGPERLLQAPDFFTPNLHGLSRFLPLLRLHFPSETRRFLPLLQGFICFLFIKIKKININLLFLNFLLLPHF